MRLKVRVWYGEKSVAMEVACGDGMKSVKWLATVATHRLTTQNAPHGRIRRSEDSNFLVPAQCKLLASDVTTENQTVFHHPEGHLVDYFEDGQRVDVIVEKDPDVDQATGALVRSRWATVAYSHSQTEKVAAALKEEYRVREETRRIKKQEDDEKKIEDDKVKAELMRELISSQLIQSDRLELKMREEWEHMNRRGLLELWIRAEKEREKVFALFKDNFFSLLELFRFYGASTTSALDAHLLEFVEFCAFCRDIGIFGGTNDVINHTTLAGAFAECAGIDVVDVKYAHFEFGDFLASLVWLALTTKGGSGGTKSSSAQSGNGFASKEAVDSAKRSIIRTRDLSQIGSAFSTSQALKQLFDENISIALKLHQSQLIGPVTKEKLATDEILAIFYVHKDRLQTAFKTYVSKLPEQGEFLLTEGYMTMNEYVVLLEHSKLIGGGGASNDDRENGSNNTKNIRHDLLTMKEVRQAFAGAQDDDLDVTAPQNARNSTAVKTSTVTGFFSQSTADSKSGSGGAGNQSLLLSFAEFLEVVLRLALLKWDDDTFTTGQKLTMAIEAILASSESKKTTTTQGRRRSSLFRGGGQQVTAL